MENASLGAPGKALITGYALKLTLAPSMRRRLEYYLYPALLTNTCWLLGYHQKEPQPRQERAVQVLLLRKLEVYLEATKPWCVDTPSRVLTAAALDAVV